MPTTEAGKRLLELVVPWSRDGAAERIDAIEREARDAALAEAAAAVEAAWTGRGSMGARWLAALDAIAALRKP